MGVAKTFGILSIVFKLKSHEDSSCKLGNEKSFISISSKSVSDIKLYLLVKIENLSLKLLIFFLNSDK